MRLLSRDTVTTRASSLGFTFAGVVRAEPSPTLDAYLRWIEAEQHGSMGYMARPDRVERRRDLNAILPGARSMIVVGLDYRTAAARESDLRDPTRGRIAAYAWGEDYHHVMGEKLQTLAHELSGAAANVYVDTGAILERSHAQQAGFGFTGKNTMLIHPRRGSTFFLGEIITDAEFDAYDAPLDPAPSCGTCTRCMAACPTDAFPKPFVLDARRCISYHTIENKGSIPVELRSRFGNWVFGCDVCQDVCPWQRFAPITPETRFFPASLDRAAPKLETLLALDDSSFKAMFTGSPVMRIGLARMVRNACVAAGNSGEALLLPALERLTADSDPLAREHAAWAVERVLSPEKKQEH